eukprot:jgi/Psemu1/301529/fgenesh1_kg.37_\
MDRKKVTPGKSYIQDGTRAFTPEYIDLLKGVVKYPKKQQDENTNIIVVHISRGKKITPCRKVPYKDFEPYLPNKHYQVSSKMHSREYKQSVDSSFLILPQGVRLATYAIFLTTATTFYFEQLLINKYSKPDHDNKVIIFSQSSSFEKFDEFSEKGYELHIDEDISDVWSTALLSDVFIMSRSSFSFVPAMVAKDSTKVVYTPFWYQPIRGWDVVRHDIQAQSDAEFQRLKSTCR